MARAAGDRQLRSQAERQVDDAIRYQGRDPKTFLNGAERTALMGIAMRRSLLWSGAAVVLALAGYAAEVWTLGWPRNPLGHALIPIFAIVAVFFYKRRRLLDRAAADWLPKRERMVAESIAILQSKQRSPP